MNNQYYEIVLNYLEQEETIEVWDVLIENIHQTLLLPVLEIELVLEDMKANQVILVVEDGVYLLNEKPYTLGQFRAVRENFGFVETGTRSIYVGKDDFNGVLDLDDVLVRIVSSEKEYGTIESIVKHHKQYIVGTLITIDGELEFKTFDKKIFKPIKWSTPLVGAADNDRVIVTIDIYGKDELEVSLKSVLGQADTPGIDVLSVLLDHGLPTEFDQEVLDAAAQVPQVVSAKDIKGRMDHRDQYIITVDGEDAKDLDDAIYIERKNNGYRLYVHIADVAHYVTQYSVIDESAYERTSSIYMVDRVVPMLPQSLSNGICSLHPHVDRLAMSVQIDFDQYGAVDDYHIYESVIQSKQRLSYNQVNHHEDLGEAAEQIEMMLELASILQYKQEQKGSIGFDSDESQFLIDENGKVLDIFKRSSGLGEAMIESFMVSANEVVAQYAKYQFLPTVYRVHEHPTKEKMQDLSHTLRILGYRLKGQLDKIHPKQLQKALEYFENKPEYPVVSRLMLRSMSKARYAAEPLGHFGLALEDYTHFTSPIRRYSDLMLHQRIKKYKNSVSDKNRADDESFASEAGLHISEKEREILDAERTVEKMKKCEFMNDKINETYVGYISGVSAFGIFVELDNTVEGLVHVRTMRDDYYIFDAKAQQLIGERNGHIYAIGQKVKVKLVAVDNEEYVIHFEFLKAPRRVSRNNQGAPRNRRNHKFSDQDPQRKRRRKARASKRGDKNDKYRKK